jgi:hypothetical protein
MNLEMILDIFNEGVYDFEILQINLATCKPALNNTALNF